MKKKVPFLFVSAALAIIGIFILYLYMEFAYNSAIKPVADLPAADAVLVFGALVYSDQQVSEVVAKRLNVGAQVYKSGKAPKIIVSGDHGRKDYDEVAAMKNYLLALDIPPDDIFLDHAGFNTYDSIYRAKEIFAIQNVILVTQEIHLKRAMYIADQLGLKASGAIAPPYTGEIMLQRIREIGARCKAFIQAGILKPEPKFLGEKIPVFSNSGTVTDDKL